MAVAVIGPGQIQERRALVTLSPEDLQGSIESFVHVEGARTVDAAWRVDFNTHRYNTLLDPAPPGWNTLPVGTEPARRRYVTGIELFVDGGLTQI